MKKSKIFWGYAVLALVIYAVVQLLISNGVIQFYYQNMFIAMCINVILAVSLHVIIGVTGQFSIGHAGFLAVGAYISAICTMKFGMPFITAILIGAIVAALAGLLVGIPSLRLKGDYLAIATLGFAEIIRIVFVNTDYVGGAAGLQVAHQSTWTYAFLRHSLQFSSSRTLQILVMVVRVFPYVKMKLRLTQWALTQPITKLSHLQSVRSSLEWRVPSMPIIIILFSRQHSGF